MTPNVKFQDRFQGRDKNGIMDIHLWLLWGAATRKRSCLGTADRGPCDVGDNGCWRWMEMACPLLFQDVSRRFKFPSHISQKETFNGLNKGGIWDCCTLSALQPVEYAPFESFRILLFVAYAWATPGVSWAMGATAECFGLSVGIVSGTWPARNVFLFILIYWDTTIWAKARGSIQELRDSSFRISNSRRVAGWRLEHIQWIEDLMNLMNLDSNSFELACPVMYYSALESLTKVLLAACIVVSEIDPTIVFSSSKSVL